MPAAAENQRAEAPAASKDKLPAQLHARRATAAKWPSASVAQLCGWHPLSWENALRYFRYTTPGFPHARVATQSLDAPATRKSTRCWRYKRCRGRLAFMESKTQAQE